MKTDDPNSWLDDLRRALNWVSDKRTKIEDLRIRVDTRVTELRSIYHSFTISMKDARRILVKYNWLVTPSMSANFLGRLIELAHQKGSQQKEIDKLFVTYYSENRYERLEIMLSSWSDHPLFRSRMLIFRDCLEALRCSGEGFNASNVIVPTLIAQIDGVRGKYLRAKGFTTKRNKWFNANGKEAKPNDIFTGLKIPKDILNTGMYVFVKVLFQNTFPGERLKKRTTFSRHKIMHGEYLHYGNKENVIRAFLILEFLSHLS